MQKKLLTSILSAALFLSVAFVQADMETETPEQGLSEIVELYKSQDWETLVRNRCLDSKHAESEAALQALIASVSRQFSDKDLREAIVSSYEAALKSKPRIEAEGTVAIFSCDLGSVKLSKMDSGVWGLRF
ncbi:hypothetical protein [Pelagicoccus sp. SDUM812003]|uniref:hypothetical protein n=1 Tax=Pelagicoccus sp. SDUM812003 TaxID=3041267 RepID=UPI0028103FA6|nr:hypothetical protein [Pelagicoccus sp. SDUM812003]MDQ8204521.1 hypothetical protein [Pelagicoccus sp. SDUM812003]